MERWCELETKDSDVLIGDELDEVLDPVLPLVRPDEDFSSEEVDWSFDKVRTRSRFSDSRSCSKESFTDLSFRNEPLIRSPPLVRCIMEKS